MATRETRDQVVVVVKLDQLQEFFTNRGRIEPALVLVVSLVENSVLGIEFPQPLEVIEAIHPAPPVTRAKRLHELGPREEARPTKNAQFDDMPRKIDDMLEEFVMGNEALQQQAAHVRRPKIDDMPRPVIILIENTEHLLPIDLIFGTPLTNRLCAGTIVTVRRPFHLWVLRAVDSRIGVST